MIKCKNVQVDREDFNLLLLIVLFVVFQDHFLSITATMMDFCWKHATHIFLQSLWQIYFYSINTGHFLLNCCQAAKSCYFLSSFAVEIQSVK